MLSSIHPLGERARRNSWPVTTVAFAVGSVGAAALVGGVLGGLGSLFSFSGNTAVAVVAAAAMLAGALDLSGVRSPGPERQVDERWIGTYRGWVYGVGFGAQLGLGVATFVVTWVVWATILAELLAGSAAGGALIGAVFGTGRAAGLVATAGIDRPSRLASFHERMHRWASPTHRLTAVAALAIGTAALVGVL